MQNLSAIHRAFQKNEKTFLVFDQKLLKHENNLTNCLKLNLIMKIGGFFFGENCSL